ncbi:calcium-binding protein [Mesorhizobium comanense]|uniref:calcium-binding protein n=1 Tax=Mesorhizobium comanense TaxID=2502215 RepID=UPI0010FA2025|nr:calcium-binding protein [Mesorhizobium comanense]
MSEIRIAVNYINFTPGFGHLQLVYVDGANETEIEVQAGYLVTLGSFVFLPARDHPQNTPNYNQIGYYYTVALDLGGREAEDVWNIFMQVNTQYYIEYPDVSYDLYKNSNSYAATLLGVAGFDISDYYDQLHLGIISSTPGSETDILQIASDAIPLHLNGTDGNDILRGGLYYDVLSGGAGDDILWGRQGADTLDGGDGWDVSDYRDSATGVNIDLTREYQVGGDAQDDKLLNIEEIRGSAHDDVLKGGPGDNILRGEGGNDTLYGSAGADRLFGGDGNDTFYLDAFGKEFAVGGAGDDIFIFDNLPPFGPMDPTIDFGNLAGTFNPTIVWGGAGADELRFVNAQNTAYSWAGIFVVYDPSLTEENVMNLDYAKLREYYHDEVVQEYNGYPSIIVVNPDADDFITYNGHRFGAVDVGIVQENLFTNPNGGEIGDRYYGYKEGGWDYDALIYQDTLYDPHQRDAIWLREATGYDMFGRPDGYPRVEIWGFRNGDFGIEFNGVTARHEYKDGTPNGQWLTEGGNTAFAEMFDTNSRFSFPISTFTLDPPGQRMAMAGNVTGRAGGDGGAASARHVAANDAGGLHLGLAGADIGDVPHGGAAHETVDLDSVAGAAPPADYIRFDGAIGIMLADMASNDNPGPGDFWYEPEPIGALV